MGKKNRLEKNMIGWDSSLEEEGKQQELFKNYKLLKNKIIKFMKKNDKNFKKHNIKTLTPKVYCDICEHYPSIIKFNSGKNVCPLCYYKFFRTEFQNKLLKNVKNTSEREIFYEFSKQTEKMKRWGQIES